VIAFVKTMMACFTPKAKWSNFSKKHFAIRKLQPFRLQRSLNFDVNYVIERKNKIINVLKGFYFFYEWEKNRNFGAFIFFR
jgi:hypothetical protein